ncbi:hypothetical protein [Streptomyces sp. NPDC001450]
MLGVAAGTALMDASPRTALLVLAAVAAIAVPVARALPGPEVASITHTPDEQVRSGVPARR